MVLESYPWFWRKLSVVLEKFSQISCFRAPRLKNNPPPFSSLFLESCLQKSSPGYKLSVVLEKLSVVLAVDLASQVAQRVRGTPEQ